MTLLRLVFDPAHFDRGRLILLAVLLGASYGLTGFVVGSAIHALPAGAAPGLALLLAYLCVVALNLYVNGLVVHEMIRAVESVALDLRQQVLDGVRRLDLPAYERIGGADIYYSLTSNPRRISDATSLLGRLVLNTVGTLGCLILIGFLSLEALGIVLLALYLVSIVYAFNHFEIARTRETASRNDQRFFRGVNSLLAGFKELKLHRPKAEEFFDTEIVATARRAEEARTRAGTRFFINYMLFTVLLLLSAGVCLYVLPLLIPDIADVALRTAIIAAMIPLSVMRDLPVITGATRALDQLQALAARLGAARLDAPAPAAARAPPEAGPEDGSGDGSEDGGRPGFRTLDLDAIRYVYTDRDGEPSFTVGPISLSLSAGGLFFIVGGNGSGKSTLVKLLTGLYPPFSGRILIDGRPVPAGTQRALISPIFSDFHLFDRLYGYRGVDPALVQHWLARLGLSTKTGFSDGGFERRDLSTGQRKRLALIATLLENRPLLVLDEWAAEQDPDSRAWYYTELLPELKLLGRTVVVVSHDERYFDVADRVFRMSEGRLLA